MLTKHKHFLKIYADHSTQNGGEKDGSHVIFGLCSGFSFSTKVGVEDLQTGSEINIKLFIKSRCCFAIKLKLPVMETVTSGENHLLPAEKKNPGVTLP